MAWLQVLTTVLLLSAVQGRPSDLEQQRRQTDSTDGHLARSRLDAGSRNGFPAQVQTAGFPAPYAGSFPGSTMSQVMPTPSAFPTNGGSDSNDNRIVITPSGPRVVSADGTPQIPTPEQVQEMQMIVMAEMQRRAQIMQMMQQQQQQQAVYDSQGLAQGQGQDTPRSFKELRRKAVQKGDNSQADGNSPDMLQMMMMAQQQRMQAAAAMSQGPQGQQMPPQMILAMPPASKQYPEDKPMEQGSPQLLNRLRVLSINDNNNDDSNDNSAVNSVPGPVQLPVSGVEDLIAIENNLQHLRSQLIQSFYADLVQYRQMAQVVQHRMMVKLAMLHMVELKMAMPIRGAIAMGISPSPFSSENRQQMTSPDQYENRQQMTSPDQYGAQRSGPSMPETTVPPEVMAQLVARHQMMNGPQPAVHPKSENNVPPHIMAQLMARQQMTAPQTTMAQQQLSGQDMSMLTPQMPNQQVPPQVLLQMMIYERQQQQQQAMFNQVGDQDNYSPDEGQDTPSQMGNQRMPPQFQGMPPQMMGSQGMPPQFQGMPPQIMGNQGMPPQMMGSQGMPPQFQGMPPQFQGMPPQFQGMPPQMGNQGMPPQMGNQGMPPQKMRNQGTASPKGSQTTPSHP